MAKFLLTCVIVLAIGCNSVGPVDTNLQSDIEAQSRLAGGFYKCDYTKPYRIILGSGGSAESLTEEWGINEKDLRSLKSNGPGSLKDIDIPTFIIKAGIYLEKRFQLDMAVFDSLEIRSIKIAEDGPENEQNRFYFIVITFLYDERGYYQKLPLLTDGRVILSSNE